ncbi:MAG: hypothetical protein Q4C03_02980 [bacterium]|nr:hypothetical protein [bacterium]
MALTGIPCAYAEWYIAEGVTEGSYTTSERFYENGKGINWHGNYVARDKAQYLWTEENKFGFLGSLENRLRPEDRNATSYDAAYMWYFNSDVNLTNDRDTCWYQASVNVIQYWQSYYGIFAKSPQDLPYGYTYDRKYLNRLQGTQSLEVGMVFYDNIANEAGYFEEATDWYLRGDTLHSSLMRSEPISSVKGYHGIETGFFSDYFSTQQSCASNTIYLNNRTSTELANAFFTGFGYTQNSAGEWNQTIKGQNVYLVVKPIGGGIEPHAITCYGFEVDAEGNLQALLITNSDDKMYGASRAYVKWNEGTKTYDLYQNEERTIGWEYSGKNWSLNYMHFIQTPELLQKMYAQYTSAEKTLSWNGKLDKWSAEYTEFTTDALPDSAKTGWDVYVDAGDMAHHNHYATYYDPTRKVEFGSHGAGQSTVTVDGTVKAAGLVLSAGNDGGYTFKGGAIDLSGTSAVSTFNLRSVVETTDGVLLKTGEGTDVFEGTEVTANMLDVDAGNLVFREDANLTAAAGNLASGATLTLSGVTANVTDMTLESGSTLAVQSPSVINGTWDIQGDVTLVMALGTSVDTPMLDIQGTLKLADSATLTLVLTGVESLPEGTQVSLFNFTQEESTIDMGRIKVSGGELAYQNGSLSFTAHSIPEPTTATLSLLALAGLCARRRRKTDV